MEAEEIHRQYELDDILEWLAYCLSKRTAAAVPRLPLEVSYVTTIQFSPRHPLGNNDRSFRYHVYYPKLRGQ